MIDILYKGRHTGGNKIVRGLGLHVGFGVCNGLTRWYDTRACEGIRDPLCVCHPSSIIIHVLNVAEPHGMLQFVHHHQQIKAQTLQSLGQRFLCFVVAVDLRVWKVQNS